MNCPECHGHVSISTGEEGTSSYFAMDGKPITLDHDCKVCGRRRSPLCNNCGLPIAFTSFRDEFFAELAALLSDDGTSTELLDGEGSIDPDSDLMDTGLGRILAQGIQVGRATADLTIHGSELQKRPVVFIDFLDAIREDGTCDGVRVFMTADMAGHLMSSIRSSLEQALSDQ